MQRRIARLIEYFRHVKLSLSFIEMPGQLTYLHPLNVLEDELFVSPVIAGAIKSFELDPCVRASIARGAVVCLFRRGLVLGLPYFRHY